MFAAPVALLNVVPTALKNVSNSLRPKLMSFVHFLVLVYAQVWGKLLLSLVRTWVALVF